MYLTCSCELLKMFLKWPPVHLNWWSQNLWPFSTSRSEFLVHCSSKMHRSHQLAIFLLRTMLLCMPHLRISCPLFTPCVCTLLFLVAAYFGPLMLVMVEWVSTCVARSPLQHCLSVNSVQCTCFSSRCRITSVTCVPVYHPQFLLFVPSVVCFVFNDNYIIATVSIVYCERVGAVYVENGCIFFRWFSVHSTCIEVKS